jgi:hypothetical protein
MYIPEEDRIKTLDGLKKNRDMMLDQLVKFPVAAETLSIKKKKMDVEVKLQEIEEAISLFSRTHILVNKQDYESSKLKK